MDEQKKEGLTVKEIGEFSKKYRVEVFLCLLLLLTCIFNFIFMWGCLSVITATIGAISGLLFSSKIDSFLKTILKFPLEQQMPTQVIIAAATLIVGIFLPPVIFLFLGLYAGEAMYKKAMS